MIYINGKMVDFSNRASDYQFRKVVDQYHSTLKGLKEKHGDVIVFRTHSQSKKDPITKMRRPAKPYSLTYKINVVDEEAGEQKWVYSPGSATVKDGVAESTEGGLIIMRGSLPISLMESPDLIFFLHHHPIFKRGTVYVHDPVSIEMSKAQERANSSKFIDYVYGEYSPLNNTEMLHKIARKWGISGVEGMIPEAIKNALYEKVNAAEEKKKKGAGTNGIAEFIADFNLGEKVEVSSNLQRAMDQGHVLYNRQFNEWHLSFDDDTKPWVLLSVDPSEVDNAKALLVDYLVHNKDDMEKINQVLSGASVKHGRVQSPEPVEKKEITVEDVLKGDVDLEGMKYSKLMKYAGELGLGSEARGQKKGIVIDLIRKYKEGKAVATE